MRKYLTEKSIRYIIAQCKQGRRTATIAYEMNVTQRHIQRIWAEFRKTGGSACTENSQGIVIIASRIKRYFAISIRCVIN